MRAIIFVNGMLPDPDAARGLIRPDDLLIGVDGGSRHALAMGLVPKIIIGDLDSLSQWEATQADLSGARITEFPQDKDATDLELALEYAFVRAGGNIILIGALGGRVDQTLGNLALLSDPRFAGARIDDGVEEAFFCRDQVEIRGRGGEIVSLIPWGGPVTGVRTQGLRWPLSDETLHPDRTRGISNELIGESSQVSIVSGLLLVVHRRKP